MNIVMFAHPNFLGFQSMPRYARTLEEGLKKRGHNVYVWQPNPYSKNFFKNRFISKWFGYIDQYIWFPREVRRRLVNTYSNTFFVFTDHALGPWVPLVADYPHVIHCHDFLAQNSALGKIPEYKTGWLGKIYQRYIRKGYLQGKNFISVSQKTQNDLHQFLPVKPACSEVVYNGLNRHFSPLNVQETRGLLSSKFKINLNLGYILHVGGNMWYKNRMGVLEIYNAWRSLSEMKVPILMIGERPTSSLMKKYNESLFKSDVHFLSDVNDEYVRMAYAGASVFLFPSLAEGFGWPIAEAMASGVPVITTNERPMTEVAGEAGFTIRKRPIENNEANKWAKEAAEALNNVLNLSEQDRAKTIKEGLANSKRFDTEFAIDSIEKIYKKILSNYNYEDTSCHPSNGPKDRRSMPSTKNNDCQLK